MICNHKEETLVYEASTEVRCTLNYDNTIFKRIPDILEKKSLQTEEAFGEMKQQLRENEEIIALI